MPQATETLRLSTAGAIGRRAAKSHLSATKRAQAGALRAERQDQGGVKAGLVADDL